MSEDVSHERDLNAAALCRPGANPYVLHYRGTLYDLSKFAERHPGGAAVLREASRLRDVELIMSGDDKLADGTQHEHSTAAYTMLKKYAVTSGGVSDAAHSSASCVDDDGIDMLNGGVIWQVGRLGNRYWSWVHEPVDVQMRLVRSDFLESLSRNNWYTIPAVWLPVLTLLFVSGMNNFAASFGMTRGSALLAALSLFAVGVAAWSLLEYVLHRFVFHWRPNCESPWQITLHFMLHGVHHKTPMDPGRLVFPPPLALIVVGIFFVLYYTTLPWAVAASFGAGKLLGYVIYDLTHYYLHHGSPNRKSFYHKRKAYHHAHHYKMPDLGYGISTIFWDQVFDTVGLAA